MHEVDAAEEAKQVALFRYELTGELYDDDEIRSFYEGTVNLSNPRAIFAGSPPRFTRSRVMYEAYVVSRTST